MKNELASAKWYFKFLRFGCDFHLTDPPFHKHLDILSGSMDQRVYHNHNKIATASTQRLIQQQAEGTTINLELLFRETQDPTIVDRLKRITVGNS